MIKERAMELVAALRSGEYEQGTMRLKDRDGCYCCLGVACHISGLGEYGEDVSSGPRFYSNLNEYGRLGDESLLPIAVRDYFGFKTTEGRTGIGPRIKDSYESLISANDGGITFSEIAEYIEQNWETL